MSGHRPGLTACLIVLNEEERLPRCLAALAFADEIVIVDGGSKDRTLQISRKLVPSQKLKLFKRPFDDFVQQKNFAISKARHEWILVVDADEVVTDGLRIEITQSLHSAEGDAGYRVPRMTFYLGKWIRHCGWYPDYNVRLFRNGLARFEGGTVHERASVQGSVGTLKAHLEHYSYRNISDHLIRIDLYSTLIAEDKFKRGNWSSPFLALYKSVSKFLLIYIWKRGFLDGRAGFVVAILGAYYNFLKYIKLWEILKGFRKPGERVRIPRATD
ncbi:MAG: glycosyltransferase family 2 protein [Leptospirales bacterium]|nr:glycosyltransferase family 2 protein [Leptospirales bacterium]